MLLVRIAAFIIALAVVAPTIAGMEKEGHSTRPGLFFAWLSPDDDYVLTRFDNTAHLRALAQHCNAGRDVFSLNGGTKYKCKTVVFETLPEEERWGSVAVTVQGWVPKSKTRQFGLFSMNPPRTAKWIAGRASPQDSEALDALLQSDDHRFRTIKRHLKLANASVVVRPEGSDYTVIVPGKIVQNHEVHYHSQRHHVFVKQSIGYSYLGEVPGKPTKFVDIDGDDLPGLVVTEGCDGLCESLWSLKGGLRRVGRFGGH